jgi:hypothetical protein
MSQAEMSAALTGGAQRIRNCHAGLAKPVLGNYLSPKDRFDENFLQYFCTVCVLVGV